MNTAERINYIIEEFCDGNANEFSRKTGIGKSTVCRLRKGDLGGIGAYAERIALAFPRINCRWMLTGTGEPSAKEAGEGEISRKLSTIIKMLNTQK